MVVLSDRAIRDALSTGDVIIRGGEDTHIQNCSVDVTLGENFYRISPEVQILNPWSADHVRNFWSDLRTASTVTTEEEADLLHLSIGQRYIILSPGESILGHTREFIGGSGIVPLDGRERIYVTTMLKARSSMGRSNVTICRDAGWGDIGYVSRWTLEITNNNQVASVVLPVGSRIGQIVFLQTTTPDTVYRGKYQTHSEIDRIMREWTPDQMLPKTHRDR